MRLRLDTPKPLQRPPDLFRLLRLCGIRDFNGTVGVYNECPLCHGHDRESMDLVDPKNAKRKTLRMQPTLANDFAFHCHNCGFTGNGLDLLFRSSPIEKKWDDLTDRMQEARVFGNSPVDPEWVARSKAWVAFSQVFEKAKATLKTGYEHDPYGFGERGIIPKEELISSFPQIGRLSQCRDARVYLHLKRSIHGWPLYVSVERRVPGMEVARYYFHPPEALELVVPEWSLYYDWSQELVLASDQKTAMNLEMLIADFKESRPAPMAWVYRCNGPIHEEIAARQVYYVTSPRESGEFALAFAHAVPEVRIKRMPEGNQLDILDNFGNFSDESVEAVEYIAKKIAAETKSDAQAIAYLDAILGKPWLTPQVKDRLTVEVAQEVGCPVHRILEGCGLNDQILPFVKGGYTYLCRNGVYLKRKSESRVNFQACSNFSLRIDESIRNSTGILFHTAELTAFGKKTRFEVSDQQFQDGRVLMRKATYAASEAGFPQIPWINWGGVSLLPEIVKGTQMASPSEKKFPRTWGFYWGSFQGPNYRVTKGGLRFESYPAEALPGCVRMASRENPEIEGLGGMDFLRQKANELATWVVGQGGFPGLLANVMLFAALAWLHRGARNLNSFLALPSRHHLEVLSWITGLEPIEVGRTRREQPGVPRIMASSYWSLDQFRRQGRIVAAMEEDDHRLDEKIMCLVHRHKETCPMPKKPPSAYLSVLCYAVVGQRNISNAIDRLVSLVDDEELRMDLQVCLSEGERYFVPPGRYLNRFLELSSWSLPIEDFIIQENQREDCLLVRRSLVRSVGNRGYQFRQKRIADEIRQRCGIDPPVTRYSREQIPVFRVPEALISAKGKRR